MPPCLILHVSLLLLSILPVSSLCCPSSSINVCLSDQIQWADAPTPEIWIICKNDYFVSDWFLLTTFWRRGSFSRHDHGVHVLPSLPSSSPSAHFGTCRASRASRFVPLRCAVGRQRTISRPEAPVSYLLRVISNTGRGQTKMAADTHWYCLTDCRYLRHRQMHIASG